MPPPEKYWKTISPSLFPWEQEALDFVFERFPAQDNYRAWANFEFIADDGSINEVDLLVVCPQGVFLVEIKSNPGTLSGDTMNWTWEHEGKRKTRENPRLLANRKCKRLKSLLARQNAFKNQSVPYFEPLIFVSHSDAKNQLSAVAASNVALRDIAAKGGSPERPGVMAALQRRVCPGLKQFTSSPVNRPMIRALSRAMDQAGIRPSQSARRVGDFMLDQLVFDSPTGAYQDWTAKHVSIESTKRFARIYMVARQSTAAEKKIITEAAHREFRLLELLDHPGILKADPPTESDHGPVLFFRRSPDFLPLDQFLKNEGTALTVHDRLDILRQITEIIQYAHGKKVLHRSLSPRSILIRRDGPTKLVVQIFNWQTGGRLPSSTGSGTMQLSNTLHAGQLVEDTSLVYLAPEAFVGGADGGGEMDVFSLGALTYLLFTGRPPAESIAELQQKLRSSLSNGLNVREAMDGAVDTLDDLVKSSANGVASDRWPVADFLAGLDCIEEELTRPDEEEKANPLEAKKGDRLAGGFVVEKSLGSGAVSKTYVVNLGDSQWVLKVARDSKYNQRIQREFEILEKLKDLQFREVVKPHAVHHFDELVGFTMESAGEETLARRITREGPLDLTLLQRFGDDLLRTVRDLDEHGITHRDIKPDNIGVRVPGKKEQKLCLFDFSLSNTSPEDIKVGTAAYLDPFISERKVKRWDVSSELFSAAMTLHEMATGLLPSWGDGKSDPAAIADEVSIRPELFDPDLRERFSAFFNQALRRDFSQRFDNPSAMLDAWNHVFVAVDKPKTDHDEDATTQIPDNVTAGTQLVLLGLSTRLLNTLDRLNLVTVADLIAVNIRRIQRLPGVGNKTRRELGRLVWELRRRLPELEIDPAKAIADLENDSTTATPDAVASVDVIAKQVAIIGRGTDRVAEQEMLQRFLGWQLPEGVSPLDWTSQSDIAPALGVTRQRIGQVVTQARLRWTKFPAVTGLRDSIYELLCSVGGVAVHREMIDSILAARGSSFDDAQRTQMASVVVRAAIETERHQKEPRFQEFRSDGHIYIAVAPELKAFAQKLGSAADELAAQDPLPSPPSVITALRAIPVPDLPEQVAPMSDNRLCQLGAAASKRAALSSRREIYPVDLAPERSLTLAQNAFFGGLLTVAELRSRIAARYSQAAPLPDRPELDKLITSLGIELTWNPAAADGQGAYEIPGVEKGTGDYTSETLTERYQTRLSAARPGDVSPQIAEARNLEGKLTHAAKHGAFLTLAVPPGLLKRAEEELSDRFPVEICDLDAVFLSQMKQEAQRGGADWQIVLQADAAAPDSLAWKNLNVLIDRCIPALKTAMRSPQKTKLLINPGLLARYDRMNVLAELAGEVGRTDGVQGIWVLLPASDQNPLPTLNQRAIPMVTGNAAQHVRLNDAWLSNKHRG
ncbi:BREX system serine/threonine kinase PglW [Synoicihabitans lomoniglobus]|uniref:BREX system serine/threonine kinase PglW n=1 Tax=Synoicihabitans lomoniglobus TaxID=2909285 RepID=A0AAE9ZW08_9BACT|nr:BREX system serine/threonine kinase PglW [Opitutaceae bacterium LMO-M01]WED64124.1 BREX system serine/threonine kinase PglW [Opitutaceae bacterium LMO-M01]